MAPVLLFSFLTGFGGSSSFSAAIKAGMRFHSRLTVLGADDVAIAATNFPENRGTATAFPLAAFGLSAFFFSSLASLLFHGDTTQLLLLLALGTSLIVVVFSVFIRIVPPDPSYTPVPNRDGSPPRRSSHRHEEAGTQSTAIISPPPPPPPSSSSPSLSHSASSSTGNHLDQMDADETSSLVSKQTTSPRDSSDAGDDHPENRSYRNDADEVEQNGSHHPDIRGLALLSKPEFWQLFSIMALLSGVGLMTIK
jgi:hypothetical protein